MCVICCFSRGPNGIASNACQLALSHPPSPEKAKQNVRPDQDLDQLYLKVFHNQWLLKRSNLYIPRYNLGVRPYGLDPHSIIRPLNPVRQLSQTSLSIGNDKWILSLPSALSATGFRRGFLSLPLELRLSVYELILPSASNDRIRKYDVSLPIQVVIGSEGQVNTRSLMRHSPELWRILPLLRDSYLGPEFEKLFWSRYEIVVDYKGVAKFLKSSAGQYVKRLKIVIGIWKKQTADKWEAEERNLKDQINTLLTGESRLEKVSVVVCNWTLHQWSPNGRTQFVKIGEHESELSEGAYLERNHKWRALAGPLLILRQRGLLKSLILRTYEVHSPNCHFKLSYDHRRDFDLDTPPEQWETTRAEITGPNSTGPFSTGPLFIDHNNWFFQLMPGGSSPNDLIAMDPSSNGIQEDPDSETRLSYTAKNVLYWLDETIRKHKYPLKRNRVTIDYTIYYPHWFAFEEWVFKGHAEQYMGLRRG